MTMMGPGVDLAAQAQMSDLMDVQQKMADRQTRLACLDIATRCRKAPGKDEAHASLDQAPEGQYVLDLAHTMYHFVSTGQKGKL